MAGLGLSEYPDGANGEDGRPKVWRTLGRSPGGAAPMLSETTKWILGLIAAAIVAYYTTVGTMQTKTAVLEEREQNHYSEVLRRLDEMGLDLKAIRKGGS